DLTGGERGHQRIGDTRAVRAVSAITDVIRDFQVDNVVGYRHWFLAVDLAHQARGLAGRRSRNFDEISDRPNAGTDRSSTTDDGFDVSGGRTCLVDLQRVSIGETDVGAGTCCEGDTRDF